MRLIWTMFRVRRSKARDVGSQAKEWEARGPTNPCVWVGLNVNSVWSCRWLALLLRRPQCPWGWWSTRPSQGQLAQSAKILLSAFLCVCVHMLISPLETVFLDDAQTRLSEVCFCVVSATVQTTSYASWIIGWHFPGLNLFPSFSYKARPQFVGQGWTETLPSLRTATSIAI